MRLLVLILALLAAGCAQCGPEPECVRGELSQLFKSRTKAKPQKNAKTATELEEAVALKDGPRVTVTQGGCAHYGVTVSFVAKEKADALASALDVLKRLKALSEREDVFQQMITLLERHGKSTKPGEPIQDKEFELTTVYLQSEPAKKGQKITVTFDFAL